jgi:hypothetical protein
LIVSWGSGGNLPPLLAASGLLAARDHRVCVLASAASTALDAGFDVLDYGRAPESSPTESRRPLVELLTQPRFQKAAEDAAAAIARDKPDEAAAAALTGLGGFAR